MATTFVSLLVYGDFSKRSRAANSAVCDRIGPNFKLIRDFYMVVLVTCKNEEDPIKKEGARVATRVPPLSRTLWELSVAMETRVLIRSDPKHIAAFPPPNPNVVKTFEYLLRNQMVDNRGMKIF